MKPAGTASVLVVHDHEGVLSLFEAALSGGPALVRTPDAERALPLLDHLRFDVVVADLGAPGEATLGLLRHVRSLPSPPEIIILTTRRGLAEARQALDQGAYAFMIKPFRAPDAARVVARAVEHRRLRAEVAWLRRELEEVFSLGQWVGTSPEARAVATQISRAADGDGDLCLQGEAGTGKELAARILHHRSRRRAGPFVAFYCAGLAPELAGAQLLGAMEDRPGGLAAQAAGGTLFLDEVAALPNDAQERLAGMLLARRGGSSRRSHTSLPDVRVVVASRVDLGEEARAGRFRRDLARLLQSAVIRLPPLRERLEDVPPLAQHFLERCARRGDHPLRGFEGPALRALSAWGWPGNCRELQLAVERAASRSPGPLVRADDLPPEIFEAPESAAPPLPALSYKEAMERASNRASRDYLAALLTACGGNVSAAARKAGIQRETLHRLLVRCGLRSEGFRPA